MQPGWCCWPRILSCAVHCHACRSPHECLSLVKGTQKNRSPDSSVLYNGGKSSENKKRSRKAALTISRQQLRTTMPHSTKLQCHQRAASSCLTEPGRTGRKLVLLARAEAAWPRNTLVEQCSCCCWCLLCLQRAAAAIHEQQQLEAEAAAAAVGETIAPASTSRATRRHHRRVTRRH